MSDTITLSRQADFSSLENAGVGIKKENESITITIPKNKAITMRLVPENKMKYLVVAQEQSALTLTTDNKDSVHEIMLNITVEGSARVSIMHLFLTKNKSAKMTEKIMVATGGKVARCVAYLHGDEITTDSLITLGGKGAEIDDIAMLFGNKRQKVKANITIIHAADMTISHSTMKGVAKDNAVCDISGLVHILPGTKKAVSYLAEHVLLLNKGAEAHAIPGMEIEAQDVQAGHSASVTHLNENHLFYAMARGLMRETAEQLIVDGFLAFVLDKVPGGAKLLKEKWQEV